ncbi:MAG TPA: efflux RND transporter periplasmic adaptor subunit [Vicinamibacterales bacterium]
MSFLLVRTPFSDQGRSDRARFPAFLPAALLAVALFTTACGGGSNAASAQQGPPPASPVKLASIEPTSLEDASVFVATLKSLSSTSIKPEVDGQVVRIFVRSGDRVKAGAPLFQIDPRRQRATVSSQSASLQAQQAAVGYAKQQLDRAQTLLKAGAISQQELDQAQTTFDTAKAQLDALQAQLHQGQVTLQYYTVNAPTDGTVGDIPIRVGTHVTSDTELTTIDRNQELEIYVQVPLARAADLHLGLPIAILNPQGDTLANTTVTYISPSVDPATQSILVKGRLAGEGTLRSSQFVQARIIWRTTTGLTVPVLSVVRINGQPFVFVADEQHGTLIAHQRAIQVGEIVGNNYRVLGGLKAGDRVVVSGTQTLFDGASIRPA